ncbi:MAG: hypothetical protein ABL902_00230 [Gallionella sp.]
MSQLSKLQKFIWTAIFSLLASGFAYMYVTADPPGYCRAQQRYIPDEEFIKTSISLLEWDMNRTTVTYPEGIVKKKKDALNYYEAIDFDPRKPNCCSVQRGQPTILERKFGVQKILLRLTPKVGGKRASYSDSLYHFKYDVCGKLLDGAGYPNTSAEEITTTNILKVINQK